ncbi:hypothetical protein [Paraburkholderia strydomiana]|uniref:hypothetical protein n=1 Tax=Paraburkholderia strydomiana TaxID=1245417 RepID=UPI0038B93F59
MPGCRNLCGLGKGQPQLLPSDDSKLLIRDKADEFRRRLCQTDDHQPDAFGPFFRGLFDDPVQQRAGARFLIIVEHEHGVVGQSGKEFPKPVLCEPDRV